MKSVFLRMFIAAICVLALFAAVPAFLHVIGFDMNGDVNILFRVAVGIAAVWWIVWGPPVPFPSANS